MMTYRRKLKENQKELTIVQRVHKRIFESERFHIGIAQGLRDDLLKVARVEYHSEFHQENLSVCAEPCQTKRMLDAVFK